VCLARLYKQQSYLKDRAVKAFSYKVELLEFQESKEARLAVPFKDIESFN